MKVTPHTSDLSNYIRNLTLPLTILTYLLDFVPSEAIGAAWEVEKQRTSLAALRPGMMEREVLALLGRPDEVRSNCLPCLADEEFRWAYGVDCKGGFARAGLVMFNKTGAVLDSCCPVLRGPPTVPFPEFTTNSSDGMFLYIDAVSRSDDEDDDPRFMTVARICAFNRGKTAYTYRNSPDLLLRRRLYVQVFDEQMRLIQERFEHQGAHSYEPKSQWPSVSIRPGQGLSEETWVWASDIPFGKPAPGTYFLRVAFPFEERKYRYSNLYKFEITN